MEGVAGVRKLLSHSACATLQSNGYRGKAYGYINAKGSSVESIVCCFRQKREIRILEEKYCERLSSSADVTKTPCEDQNIRLKKRHQ